MKSQAHGIDTSQVEILNVSQHGIWVWVVGKEHFIDYDFFPWFKKATLDQILKVQLLHGHHLYWPSLDIDLELESLESPEKYPLLSR